jgi:hypothetical protein
MMGFSLLQDMFFKSVTIKPVSLLADKLWRGIVDVFLKIMSVSISLKLNIT